MSMVALEQRVGMLPKEKVMVICVPFTNNNDMIKQRIGSCCCMNMGALFMVVVSILSTAALLLR